MKDKAEPPDSFFCKLKSVCKELNDKKPTTSKKANEQADREFTGDPFFVNFAETIQLHVQRPIYVPYEVLHDQGLVVISTISEKEYGLDHGLVLVFDALWKKKKTSFLQSTIVPAGKSSKKFLDAKEQGNQMFGKRKYLGALKFYNECVNYAGPQDLSVAYFNRSAALFHTRQYKLCLQDCLSALAAKYATPIRVHTRMIESVRAIGLGPVTAEGLDVRTDPFKYVVSFIEKIPDKREPIAVSWFEFLDLSESYRYKDNPAFSAMCDGAWTHPDAVKDIPVGHIVFVEEAYVSVLNPKYYHDFCQECLREILVAVPCEKCSTVSFCSVGCRNECRFHAGECSILPTLVAERASFPVFIVLRILMKQCLEEFIVVTLYFFYKEFVDKSRGANRATVEGPLASFLSDVEAMPMDEADLTLEHIACARFLFNILKKDGFLNSVPRNGFITPSLISGLSGVEYHRFYSLCFIFKHIYSGRSWCKNSPITKAFSIFENGEDIVGVGRYPSAKAFPHSCDPNLTPVFLHDRLLYIARRPIKKDESLTVSQGPMITKHDPEARNLLLEAQELFCYCQACEEFEEESLLEIYDVCKRETISVEHLSFVDGQDECDAHNALCFMCFELAAFCPHGLCQLNPKLEGKLLNPSSFEFDYKIRELFKESIPNMMKLKPYMVDKLHDLARAISVLAASKRDIARIALETKFDSIILYLYALAGHYNKASWFGSNSDENKT